VTATRAGWVVVALVGAACAPAPRITADPVAVEVAARPCTTPNRRFGAGVFVTDELVLTAAHVVDGDVRVVTVDGRPAHVVAVDDRLDAALVATSSGNLPAATLRGTSVGADRLSILSPGAPAAQVTVRRTGDLVVHDHTARVSHRRRNVVLAGAVVDGTSGAPVVDESGRVVAMVTLTDAGRRESHATEAGELLAFVTTVRAREAVARTRLDQAGHCP
jgi:S1-C subfamily serine protease